MNEAIEKLSGDAFFMELSRESIEMLMRAYKLDFKALSEILECPKPTAEGLLAGEEKVTRKMALAIQKNLNIIPLFTLHPRVKFLCQLTPRSLRIVRKGRQLTSIKLAALTGKDVGHLRRVERDDSGTSPELAEILSKGLGVHFFIA